MPTDLLRYTSLEMRHLRLALAVAEERSLTRAAARLRLTTSALSHQLRQLEGLTGKPMFHRDGRSMRATPAGETVVAAARNALAVVQNAEEHLQRGAAVAPEVIRLCTQCYTGYSWLPAIISSFMERSRGLVDVRISVESTRQPFAALHDRKLDLALTLERPTDPEFAVHSLFENELLLLVAASHRLAKQSWVKLSELQHEHLILHQATIEESSFYRHHLLPASIRPKRYTGIMLTEAIIEMVKAGLGATVLPAWTAANYLGDGNLIARRMTSRGLFRHWYAVTRKRPDNPKIVADLIALVAKQMAQNKPGRGTRAMSRAQRRPGKKH